MEGEININGMEYFKALVNSIELKSRQFGIFFIVKPIQYSYMWVIISLGDYAITLMSISKIRAYNGYADLYAGFRKVLHIPLANIKDIKVH